MKNKTGIQQLDNQFRVLRTIERNPELSQREMAASLGLSLGSVNYCLKALVEKGWIKSKNFTNSANKRAYAYLLTKEGVQEKTKLASGFLQRKMQEYQTLQLEIQELQEEVELDKK